VKLIGKLTKIEHPDLLPVYVHVQPILGLSDLMLTLSQERDGPVVPLLKIDLCAFTGSTVPTPTFGREF